MSLTTSEMTPADFAAVTGNNNNNDGFGGNGAWGIIILFLFALCGGWGGNGFGGFGGGSSYTRGSSYARGRRYSRDGYSRAAEDIKERMMDMLNSGDFTSSQRQSIQRMIDEM